MKDTRSGLVTVAVVLFVAAFLAGTCLAQQQSAPPAPAKKAEAVQKTMIKGKIGFVKSMNYYIQGEEPAHEFMITNQNPRLLKKLMKSGKSFTIEGHYDMGADRIFIETIDGKKYRGK